MQALSRMARSQCLRSIHSGVVETCLFFVASSLFPACHRYLEHRRCPPVTMCGQVKCDPLYLSLNPDVLRSLCDRTCVPIVFRSPCVKVRLRLLHCHWCQLHGVFGSADDDKATQLKMSRPCNLAGVWLLSAFVLCDIYVFLCGFIQGFRSKYLSQMEPLLLSTSNRLVGVSCPCVILAKFNRSLLVISLDVWREQLAIPKRPQGRYSL